MRFLLSGYYGFGNLGDEALARVIVTELRARYPAASLNILSADPVRTAREFGVDSTPRADLGRLRSAIEHADVVLSGGGGLLQNATSTRSLLYYAGILARANAAGRKSMIFAQSIGPLDFIGKAIVRKLCRKTTRATVRDERSKKLLDSLLPNAKVERTADPVFLYGDAPAADLLQREGLDTQGNPLVIVCVRKAPGLHEGTRIIARAHAVIGMRLHALIFAIRYGVPFLAIPYDPKVAALCEDIAYPLPPLWVPGSKKPAQDADVDDLVAWLWDAHAAIAAQLRSDAVLMRARAARNFDELDELVCE
ncbi:MAG: hypothetical protein NVS1B14_07750 [Vulcanimicrobiaceae bacterium]